MNEHNDIVTTFLAGTAFLFILGITIVTILSWIFS